MTANRQKQEYKATAIRLPPDVHAAVHRAAKQEERSFNGQIVAVLRAALLKPQQQDTQGAAQ